MTNNNIKEKSISIVSDFVTIEMSASLEQIYKRTKREEPDQDIIAIRLALSQGDLDTVAARKRKLKAFTVSGTFIDKRKDENLDKYSGFIVLDMDHLTPTDLFQAREKAKLIPYTVMYFVSPSGEGLKIIVAVDSGAEQHRNAYDQVIRYYNEELGLPFDVKTKDIARLCFFSHDPEAYINYSYETFKVEIENGKKIVMDTKELATDDSYIGFNSAFNQAVDYTSRRGAFQKGNRNNYVFLLAANCNRYGLDMQRVIRACLSKYVEAGFESKEIEAVITSVYNKNSEQFNTWTLAIAKSTTTNTEVISSVVSDSKYIDTPFIPDSFYTHIPELLSAISMRFSDQREKDVFMSGIITLLSGCFPRVTGNYNGVSIQANLYNLIIAPAASGKGVLKGCRDLLLPYHQLIVDNSNAERKKYKSKYAAYEAAKGTGRYASKPEEPPYKKLFLPGNSSAHTMYQQLQCNDGRGIICETEADSLGYLLKHDRDIYATIFRNCFHHEPISICRKESAEAIEIQHPQLSVVLSGTADQLSSLISTVKDGLFSRFVFYTYQPISSWQYISPDGAKAELEKHIAKTADQLVSIITFMGARDYSFEFTAEQWTTLNTIYNGLVQSYSKAHNNNFDATIKRMGLITYRIAMVLASISAAIAGDYHTTLVCSDQHFQSAVTLASTYIKHAEVMYEILEADKPIVDTNMRQLANALPHSFGRKEAIEIASSLGLNISTRTVDNYLKRLTQLQTLCKRDNKYYQQVATELKRDTQLLAA